MGYRHQWSSTSASYYSSGLVWFPDPSRPAHTGRVWDQTTSGLLVSAVSCVGGAEALRMKPCFWKLSCVLMIPLALSWRRLTTPLFTWARWRDPKWRYRCHEGLGTPRRYGNPRHKCIWFGDPHVDLGTPLSIDVNGCTAIEDIKHFSNIH